MSDYVTGFQTKNGIKKYDYNSLANLPDIKDITDTVISPNADYAEVGEWADGNLERENRLGYFVAIAAVGDNTIKIRKATSTDDVRGVSVYNPAFSGNASKDKYGENGELLPQYNYIGVMGIVEIIDNGLCTVGGRCMPADDGTATPSSNNMGYAILERVDESHVLIAIEPGADMVQRVKTDVENIEKRLDSGAGGLSEELLKKLNDMLTWYSGQIYKKMTASLSASKNMFEIGPKRYSFTLSWSFTEDVSSVTLNNAIQTASQKGSIEMERSHSPDNYNGADMDIKYTITGTRKDGDKETANASCTIKFRNRYYYGYAADPRNSGGKIDSTFIRSMQGLKTGLIDKLPSDFEVRAASGTYIWYAYPSRLGKVNISMAPIGTSQFQSPVCEEPIEVDVTNNIGFIEKYYVYRSYNTGLNQKLKVEV